MYITRTKTSLLKPAVTNDSKIQSLATSKVRQVHSRVWAHFCALFCAFFCTVCAMPPNAWGWSLFEKSVELLDVELSAGEMAQVEILAGWAPPIDDVLIFSIKNKLPAPISCSGALVNLKNGKTVKRALLPRLYITPSTAKQFSVSGVTKESLKDYSLTCYCSKTNDSKLCIDPIAAKKQRQ